MTAGRRPTNIGRGLCPDSPGRRFPACLLAFAAALAATAALASSAAAAPVPKLNWQRCAPPQQDFQCSSARVPRSYSHPHRSKIHLAVIRHPATDPAHRVGTLFLNFGGPGQSIPNFNAGVFDLFIPKALQRRFDIVGWDLRGLGQSTAVQCFDSQADENKFLDGVGEPTASFPVGKAQQHKWISTYRRLGRRCEERNPSLLRHVSTAESARDMNLLRRAVGDRKLNYWGISYGTFLGATYANLFPKRVRAMILDGDINPTAWTHRHRKANGGRFLATFLRQHSDQGAAKTLGAFLDLCGQTDTAHCAFSAGSSAATRAEYATLLRRLRAHPARFKATYSEVVSTTGNRLYAVAAWSALASCLEDVWKKRPMCPQSAAPTPDAPTLDPTLSARTGQAYAGPEQSLSIICSESPNPRPGAFRSLDRFAYDRSGPLGPWWSWSSEPCASWPATAPNRYAGPWDRRTANPILVMSTTFDPATPYRGAVAMSRKLARARLLRVDGYGHTALTNPSACAYRHASRYLIDKVLPPKGTRCKQDQTPFQSKP